MLFLLAPRVREVLAAIGRNASAAAELLRAQPTMVSVVHAASVRFSLMNKSEPFLETERRSPP